MRVYGEREREREIAGADRQEQRSYGNGKGASKPVKGSIGKSPFATESLPGVVFLRRYGATATRCSRAMK